MKIGSGIERWLMFKHPLPCFFSLYSSHRFGSARDRKNRSNPLRLSLHIRHIVNVPIVIVSVCESTTLSILHSLCYSLLFISLFIFHSIYFSTSLLILLVLHCHYHFSLSLSLSLCVVQWQPVSETAAGWQAEGRGREGESGEWRGMLNVCCG